MSRVNVGRGSDVVFVSEQILSACSAEATRMFPLETGGVFMGYWVGTRTVVVTQMFGPGPSAIHGRYHFEPDADWQWQQIASHYELTGRQETYVGDWHSHPRARHGDLSWIDLQAVATIATAPSSRCPAPMMCILWGQSTQWQATTWRVWLRQTPRRNRLDLRVAQLRILIGERRPLPHTGSVTGRDH